MTILQKNTVKSLKQTTLKKATDSPLLKKFNVNGVLTQATYRKPKDIKKSFVNSIVNKGINKYNKLTTAAFNGTLTVNKAKEIIFGKQTLSLSNIFNKNNLLTFITSGYAGDVNTIVRENQLVRISIVSKNLVDVITGLVLQKEFITSLRSNWQTFIPAVDQETDTEFQSIYGKSLLNPISSRRMWMGTSPLKLSLELHFIAINDAKKEVDDPINKLQRLILPSYSGEKALKLVPLLTPPGPSPTSSTDGEQISITIGNVLTLEPVIISEVTVRRDNKTDANGFPISAIANIEIESYEILTKEKFSLLTGLAYNTPTALVEGNNKATKEPTTIPLGT